MSIREDLGLFAAGETMLEAVDKVAEEHERNLRLALLLLAGVRALDTRPADPGAVAESFMLKLLSLSGFHPSLTACAACGSQRPPAVLARAWAGPSAPNCAEGGVAPVSRAALVRLQRLAARDLGDAGDVVEDRIPGSARNRAGSSTGSPSTTWSGGCARLPMLARTRAVSYLPDIDPDRVPAHVAIVMDGNGRWATQRGLPRTDGHAAGEEALATRSKGGVEVGLKWLTVYAFSSENWRRPAGEVLYLMNFNRDAAPPAPRRASTS